MSEEFLPILLLRFVLHALAWLCCFYTAPIFLFFAFLKVAFLNNEKKFEESTVLHLFIFLPRWIFTTGKPNEQETTFLNLSLSLRSHASNCLWGKRYVTKLQREKLFQKKFVVHSLLQAAFGYLLYYLTGTLWLAIVIGIGGRLQIEFILLITQFS